MTASTAVRVRGEARGARFALKRLPFLSLVAVAPLLAACGSSTSTATSPSTISRCAVTLGATDATVPAQGGTGQIAVTTARECQWTAAPDVSWLSIRGNATGQGDGSVEFAAAANPDPATRRGGITLNNQRAEIVQAAAPCTIQLGQASASFTPAGGQGSVDVRASSALCTWTASADVDWITIRSASGKGSASVTFDVAATSGLPRTGTIAIGGDRVCQVGEGLSVVPIHTRLRFELGYPGRSILLEPQVSRPQLPIVLRSVVPVGGGDDLLPVKAADSDAALEPSCQRYFPSFPQW